MERMVRKLKSRVLWGAASLVLATLAVSGCATSPEAKEARFLEAGKTALAKKEYGRAIIQFKNAAQVKKGDAEAYYQLGMAYIATGDYRLGIPILKKALELNPKHLQAQIKMAELLASANKEEYLHDAEAQARIALLASPGNTDALNALAIAEWKLGQHRNAEMDFLRAVNSAPQNIQASLNLAKVKVYGKDLVGAEQIIKQASIANPTSVEPIVAIAALYMIMGKVQAAEQQYRRAVQTDSKSELALLNLASFYVNSNRVDQAEHVYKQISALPDRKYKPLHARFLFQSGKRDQAITEFENLFREDPSNRATRTELVEAYFAVGKLAEAEKVLTPALSKNNKDLDALLQRSRIYLQRGNHSDAQKDVELGLRFQPDSARAHYLMARICEIRGQTLMRRMELSEAVRLDKFLLPARLDLVQVLTETNGASTALQVLDEAPDSQKIQLPVVEARSWTLWSLGNMAELRRSLDAALRVVRTPDLLILDGLWKLKAGKAAAARASLEEALKINPGDLRALEVLSRSYKQQQQGSVALEKVKEYAARQPKSAPVQSFLGMLLMANGERKQARAAFEAAETADPQYLNARLSLVQSDVLDGKFDEAQRRLEALLASNGQNAVVRLWLAHTYLLKGNQKAALEQYRQVVVVDPKNAQAWNNLAYLVAEFSNQPSEALKYAQQAKELAPERGEYSDTLGWVLYRLGTYPLAVQQLERAASLEQAASKDGEPLWKYHLAMAYAKAGNLSRARATLQVALKQNPNLAEAKTAQDVLASAQKQASNAH